MAGIDWNELLAGGAGAANEILFGAPEWLIRKLGGGAALDEKLAKYGKAYKTGGTVGLVGSALIPYGAVAKGITGAGKAAKAVKGAGSALDVLKRADVAGDVGRAAEAIKAAETAAPAGKSILQMAAKGAGLGAAEQGARGFFKDETPEEIARDVSSGMLFGGLGGGAAGALSKYAPKLAKLGKKTTEKATLGLTDVRTRELLQAAQRLAGEGSGPMAQVRKIDDIRGELSDLIKRKKLWKEGAVEAAAGEQKKIWDTLDEAYERVVGGQKGAEVLKGALSEADAANLAKKYDPEVLKAALEKVMKPIQNRTGLANIRDKLEAVAKYARTGKEESAEVADAMFEISKLIRGNLDNAVIKTAEAAGVKIPANFKREYGLLLPIAKGEVRAEIAPTKFGLGSPTFEKAAAASLLGGGSLALGGPDEELGKKLERAGLAAALGFGGQKLLSAGLRKGVSSADTLAGMAEKLAPKLAEAPEKVAGVAGREAANIARAAAATAPETEGEEVAAQDGAEIGQAETKQEYMSLVLDRLTQYAKANGVEEGTQDYKDFISAVAAQTVGADGIFDPAALSHVLYPNPEERQKFTKALEISRGLNENLTTALRSPGGIAGIGASPEIALAKQASIDKLGNILGEAAKAFGGTEATAKKMLAQIINSRATQKEKRAMIQGLMEDYGVDFGTLGRVGLNV